MLAGTETLPVDRHYDPVATNTVPSEIKIYYGDMAFWRAECVRLCLFMGNVPFQDIRYKNRSDPLFESVKPKLTFGATPVMEVDGKVLSQTQAMASFASKIAGMAPHDAWQAAKVDEAINGCTDCTTDIGATFRISEQDAKLKARSAMIAADGRLTLHLNGLEKLIVANGSKSVVVGDRITVADLAIWRMVGWISSGVIDGVPQDYISKNFPQIQAVYANVDAHPKVKEWKAAHPNNYK